MPSYSPEQAFVTKFYTSLKKNEFTMETLNFSCSRTSKLLLKWAGIMRWWDWTCAGDSCWSFGSRNWKWLKEIIPGELCGGSSGAEGSLGREPMARSTPGCGHGAWLAGRSCSRSGLWGAWSIQYWFQVPESITLHLELLLLQDLGCACSGWVFEQICGFQCCSLTRWEIP